jgi:DNA polymerase III subunit alpha
MSNYVVYHLHSDLSNGVTNIDSVTKYNQYIDYAHELGMTAIGFSEHGSVFQWLKKKQHCEELGMKYIHGSEFYVTENLSEKVRDNYHCVLIAKNYNGFLEINKLSSISFNRANVKCVDGEEHVYYTPRITFDELISTSENVIITSACLGGILNKGNENLQKAFLDFLLLNKKRCFLEVQHHLNNEQKEYNKKLYEINCNTGIRLIAGTDTHCLNGRHSKGRVILQKAKNIHFSDEDGWDLTFKTYDELCKAYKEQNVLSESVYLEAVNNTNLLADMVETFEIDKSYKYPHLWDNPLETFRKAIYAGVKKRGVDKYPNCQEYYDRIKYELKSYVHNQAIDFMLLMADIINWCKANNIEVGYGRGSVNGSVIAWLLGITEMDSVKFNLNFDRFLNIEKVSLSDIDTDFPPSRRDDVKNYIFQKHGLYCSDIITFNTIALKGAIRDVARALEIPLDEVSAICELAEQNEGLARKKHPELFDYVDIVNGTIVSVGSHPCGSIVAPFSIDDKIGLFTTSTSKYPISQLNMKEIDCQNYVKLDLLSLDTIELINTTCELAGIDRLTPDNVDADDINVWNSMRDDTTQIFQWEGNTGNDYIKKLFADENILKLQKESSTLDRMTLLSIGNGAIRPAGASYRDDIANGVVRKTGSKVIDDFLSSTFGCIVFQCQIIEFLHKCCGFTMGEADIVRRGFAKKTGTDKFIPIIKDGGYLTDAKTHYIKGFITTMYEEYGIDKEKSKEDIISFIQVISDASDYLFSINHSLPYSYEGYVCGYLRYYYPVEFLTTALNINYGNEEKTQKITAYAKSQDITINPIKFRYSKAMYAPDKSNNAIYKGISSVKFLNSEIADKLYEMRDIKFQSFIDFLKVNPCNSRQTEILIKLDFFSEFGKAARLLEIYSFFNTYNGKKLLDKSKCNVPREIVVKYAAETDKRYKFSDIDGFIAECCNAIPDKDISVNDKISAQLEFLGYVSFAKSDLPKNYILVTKLETKYTPKFTAYCLNNGKTCEMKIHKNKNYKQPEIKMSFKQLPLEEGDIICLKSTKQEPKRKKVNNEWQSDYTQMEWWINDYSKVTM